MFDFDFADVKPSLMSWIIVGMLAISFIYAGKIIFGKYHVPYVSELFAGV